MRCHCQQMGWAIITEQLSGFAVATDQKTGFRSDEGGGFLVSGEAGRAVGLAFHAAEADHENNDDEEQQELD